MHTILPLVGPDSTGLGSCFDDMYNMNPRELNKVEL